PAVKTRIQVCVECKNRCIPACAGMTEPESTFNERSKSHRLEAEIVRFVDFFTWRFCATKIKASFV
ncbi:MAG TPA: hypothetical protein VFU70_05015, partial [Pseudolabrys sp.]|nr:hypothetical protein [Pseudolabrys sp.]